MALLGVSRRTFTRYREARLIVPAGWLPMPYSPTGKGHARFRRGDVLALLDRARQDAHDESTADADTGAARTSLTVTAGALLTVVLVVGAIRPEVLLGYLFAVLAVAVAFVALGLIGGAVHDGSIALGQSVARRHRLGRARVAAYEARRAGRGRRDRVVDTARRAR